MNKVISHIGGNTMKLQKTQLSQIDTLVKISKSAFDSDISVGADSLGGPPCYDSKPWHIQMMNENHLYTALENDEIIGGAVVFVDNNNPENLYIGRIFIAPECFRKGYGSLLMSAIETLFKNTKLIALDTPLWNTRTNNFYKKLGYIETKRDFDSVYYQKNLTSKNVESPDNV